VPCHDTALGRWSRSGDGGTHDHSKEYANSSCTKDAFVLGRLLAHPLTTSDNVHAALKAYQDVRLPASHFVVRKSEDMGYMYEFDAPGYYDGTDRGNEQEELELLKEKIIDSWCWGESGAIAEWLEAEKKLQESVELI
jgi:hypothetical protein